MLLTFIFLVLILGVIVSIIIAWSSSKHIERRNATVLDGRNKVSDHSLTTSNNYHQTRSDDDDEVIHIVYATDEHVLPLTLISVTSIVHHAVNLSNIHIYFVLINTRSVL